MTTAHPSNYTKGRTQKIEFLVLHYTAGRNDSAAGNLRYFESPRGASAHYFVDRKGWLQSVDDGDTAWSVGTAGVYQQKHPRCRNGNSISIEMCCRYQDGVYSLEPAVVQNAALLTRKLCASMVSRSKTCCGITTWSASAVLRCGLRMSVRGTASGGSSWR